MANKAYRNISGQSIIQPGQVLNNAGGAAWQIGDISRLRRFLILGSEGGTYYVNERALTVQNANVAIDLVKKDGIAVVELVKQVSTEGLAPSNEQALFVLAIAAELGSDKVRQAAYDALPIVARTGTHLYHYVAYAETIAQAVNGNSGWSRGRRNAVARWFNNRSASDIEYQLTKYQSRDGWSAADMLRLAHVKPVDKDHSEIYSWAVDGWDDDKFLETDIEKNHPRIYGMEAAQRSTTAESIVNLIRTYDLAREHIPTQFLNSPEVWDALLYKMPLEAMIRNLGKMSAVGLLVPGSLAETTVIERLADENRIRKSRLHPMKIIVAERVYASGQGMKGGNAWRPVRSVVDAMEGAFYMAFKNVEPTGKKTQLALDVSGSMTFGNLSGMPITPREAVGVLAMVSKRVEHDNAEITAFGTHFVPVDIQETDSLEKVMKLLGNLGMMGTDCAQPMLWASKNRRKYDGFVIYTDNETWAGHVPVDVALRDYRNQFNKDARLVVVGMTSTGFSIANPKDQLALDVAGFSTDTPQVIADFVAGRI